MEPGRLRRAIIPPNGIAAWRYRFDAAPRALLLRCAARSGSSGGGGSITASSALRDTFEESVQRGIFPYDASVAPRAGADATR